MKQQSGHEKKDYLVFMRIHLHIFIADSKDLIAHLQRI